MTTYRFPAAAGLALDGGAPTAAAITDRLAGLGLSRQGLMVTRHDDAATLDGTVPDEATRERVLLVVGNLQGIARVEDRLTVTRPGGLFDTLAAFARIPAGSSGTEAAERAVHRAVPDAGDTGFGPGGSILHLVQAGRRWRRSRRGTTATPRRRDGCWRATRRCCRMRRGCGREWCCGCRPGNGRARVVAPGQGALPPGPPPKAERPLEPLGLGRGVGSGQIGGVGRFCRFRTLGRGWWAARPPGWGRAGGAGSVIAWRGPVERWRTAGSCWAAPAIKILFPTLYFPYPNRG